MVRPRLHLRRPQVGWGARLENTVNNIAQQQKGLCNCDVGRGGKGVDFQYIKLCAREGVINRKVKRVRPKKSLRPSNYSRNINTLLPLVFKRVAQTEVEIPMALKLGSDG